MPSVCALSVSLPAAAGPRRRRAGEFRVNTYTAGNQRRPVARNGRTGTSSSSGRAAPRTAIASGRSASGSRRRQRRGREFRVNTYTPGPPGPAADCRREQGQLRRRLGRASRTGPATASTPGASTPRAAPSAGEFQVNTLHHRRSICRPQRRPWTSDGNFVVSWSAARNGQLSTASRPALRRVGQPARQRVPGEHLHHRIPVRVGGVGVRRQRQLRRRLGGPLRLPRRLGSSILGQRFDAAGRRWAASSW